MYVYQLAQAAAIFAVAVGLSAWRVFAAPGPMPKGTDQLLGLCTAVASCWVLAAALALETSAFHLA